MPSLKRKSEAYWEDGRTGSAGIEANAAGGQRGWALELGLVPRVRTKACSSLWTVANSFCIACASLRFASGPTSTRYRGWPTTSPRQDLHCSLFLSACGNSARVRIPAIGRDLNHPHLLRRWVRGFCASFAPLSQGLQILDFAMKRPCSPLHYSAWLPAIPWFQSLPRSEQNLPAALQQRFVGV